MLESLPKEQLDGYALNERARIRPSTKWVNRDLRMQVLARLHPAYSKIESLVGVQFDEKI